MIVDTIGVDEVAAFYRIIAPIEPPTWHMADDVIAAGFDGLLFPSQARPGGTNLVIYRSSSRDEGQLRVYDPDSLLQRIAPSTSNLGTR